MTLCLCRADAHGAPEGQGQRSLDSESIDVGLCGFDKDKGRPLWIFFFRFSKSLWLKKTNTKIKNRMPYNYVIQCPRTAMTCSRPTSEVVYWSPCSYFSVKPLSRLQLILKNLSFPYELFALKHHIWIAFCRHVKSPFRELGEVGL